MLRCVPERLSLQAWAAIVGGAAWLARVSEANLILNGANLSRNELRIAQLEADALAYDTRTSPFWRDMVRAALAASRDEDGSTLAEVLTDAANSEQERSTAVARRPVLVLKMARTGSTWLGNALRDEAGLCAFHNEVTNIPVVYRGLTTANESNCAELASYVRRSMQCRKSGVYGGITLNPFKFDVHNPLEPGSCWSRLHETLTALGPQVIILNRENVIAQAASDLKSIEIKALGLCGRPEDSWHLDRCGAEAQEHQISPDPAKFLTVVREKNATNNQLLSVGQTLAAGTEVPLQLTMEEMFDDGKHGLALPPRLLEYIGVTPAAEQRPAAAPFDLRSFIRRGARGRSSLRVTANPPREPVMRRVLANYGAVHEYFADHAPELLPLLTKA